MKHISSASRGGVVLVLLLLAAVTPAAFAQSQALQTVTGAITSVDPGSITLITAGGHPETVELTKDTQVFQRQPASLADITAGEALGVAARKEADGSLTATSINIFSPELWNEVKKGQFPMQSGQVMTNAVVDNLTVDMVMGRTLFMKYGDVTAAISVPPQTDIHRILTVRGSDLKPGLTVSVRQNDEKGTLSAATVSFDKPGA